MMRFSPVVDKVNKNCRGERIHLTRDIARNYTNRICYAGLANVMEAESGVPEFFHFENNLSPSRMG